MQLLPNIKQQFLDGNGAPLTGGKLYSYAAGTSTPLATYTDGSGGTPNANPVILDANGVASIWISTSAYKFVLKDSLGTTLSTTDNVSWVPDGSVSTPKIVDGAVTTPKIPDGAITGPKLDTLSVDTNNLVDFAVTTPKVKDGAITNVKAGYGHVPPGAILPFGGAAAPTGFLLCDGASYLRATYLALSAALGSSGSNSNFGAADATHFNVPDLRGQFLRGVTSASGNDPDAAGRTAMATGGNGGNNVGSIQGDNIRAHTHPVSLKDASGNGTTAQGTNGATSTGSTTTVSTGGNETRPTNAYVTFIIKT